MKKIGKLIGYIAQSFSVVFRITEKQTEKPSKSEHDNSA